MQNIIAFLMFDGRAEEAINFYVSVFKPAQILNINRYQANEGGEIGKVKIATFMLKGQEITCIDSSGHNFGFTPAISLFVNCDTEEEIDTLFQNLSNGGKVMMPLAAYPFSKKYCWVSDKFGVSWQLSLISHK